MTEREKNTGKYVNPLTDFGFKRIFGDEQVLRAFLNAMIEPEAPICSVEFLNNEVPPEVERGRGVTYDIRCKTDDGREFIVEMQNAAQTYLADRIVYYLSRSFSSQRRRGRDSRTVLGEEKQVPWDYHLRPTYCVFFLNFHMRGLARQAKRSIRLKVEETGEVFSDSIAPTF